MHRREKKRWSKLRSLSSLEILLHGEDEKWTGFKVPKVSQKESQKPDKQSLEDSGVQPEFADYLVLEDDVTAKAEPVAETETPEVEPIATRETIQAALDPEPSAKVTLEAQAKTVSVKSSKPDAQVEVTKLATIQSSDLGEKTVAKSPPPKSPKVSEPVVSQPAAVLDLDRLSIGEFLSFIPFDGADDQVRAIPAQLRSVPDSVLPSLAELTAKDFFSVVIPWEGQTSEDGPDLAQLMGMATRDAMGRADRFGQPLSAQPSNAGSFFQNINWQGETLSAS